MNENTCEKLAQQAMDITKCRGAVLLLVSDKSHFSVKVDVADYGRAIRLLRKIADKLETIAKGN